MADITPPTAAPMKFAAPVQASIDSALDTVAQLPDWAAAVIYLAVPLLGALLVHRVILALMRKASSNEKRSYTRKLVKRTAPPGRFLAALIGLAIGMELLVQRGLVGGAMLNVWPQVFAVLLTLAITWLVLAMISGIDDIILSKYRVDVRDNLRARRMHTQVRVLSRTIMFIVGVIGVAIALLQFDGVEEIGASLLASAGILGIAVGFAARPVLGNLIAGIQIALTQPIRLDDAVVIEGEWGWIEEITSTYVVVRIWDQRRLIVPFSKIIEEPFQNWTRTSADILGAVVLYVDYACPVQALREELDRILDGHPKWDGRAKVLQVIETTEKTMVLRALVTAGDSPTAWELRCDVRERLLNFLQREHPYALPREREVQFHEDQWPTRAIPPKPRDAKDMDESELEDPTLRGEGGAPPPPPPEPPLDGPPDGDEVAAEDERS